MMEDRVHGVIQKDVNNWCLVGNTECKQWEEEEKERRKGRKRDARTNEEVGWEE